MKTITETLFSGRVHELESSEIEVVLDDVPTLNVSAPINILDALLALGAISSKSEGRKLIEGRGVLVDGVVIEKIDQLIAGDKKIRVVKKGKKNYYLLKF